MSFTAVCAYHQLRFLVLSFGVVTPPAVERAAFHEYGRPNPRPIIDGVALNIKYSPGGHAIWITITLSYTSVNINIHMIYNMDII